MRWYLNLAVLMVVASALPAVAQQLIHNPGIEGTAADSPIADIHTRNNFNGVLGEPDGLNKWWSGVTTAVRGHCSSGGNPDILAQKNI